MGKSQVENSLWQEYWVLCKPKVVGLMVITALVGMFLASPNQPDWSLIFWAALGIALIGGASATINHMVDYRIDALMLRTRDRPLAKQRLSMREAQYFALILGSLGFWVLYSAVNPLTAFLSLATLVGYSFVYTVFLKRLTPQNIVIGGMAGATPPLLGWVAVTNHIDPYAWLLVILIFIWTPPHFWALAIHRLEDYKRAEIPMLPVTHGILFTKQCIFLYALLLLICSLLPYLTGMSGAIYALMALGLGLWFLGKTVGLYRDTAKAYSVFKASVHYLWLLFLGLLLDHAFKNYIA
ncbi:MAG: heme o synthase [Gammaproteobacteria bacterium]